MNQSENYARELDDGDRPATYSVIYSAGGSETGVARC